MKDICAIFRYILNMTHDFMDSSSSILIFRYPLLIVKHHKIRLFFRVRMNPYINETVDLFDRILPLHRVLCSHLPFGRCTLLTSKIVLVLQGIGHDRFPIVI